jgi:hypothetical protein
MGHSYKGRGINASAVSNSLIQPVLTGQGTATIGFTVTGVQPVTARVDSAGSASGPWSFYVNVGWPSHTVPSVPANWYQITGLDASGIVMTLTSAPGQYT